MKSEIVRGFWGKHDIHFVSLSEGRSGKGGRGGEEVELTNHHFCQNGSLHDEDLALSIEISEDESRFGSEGDIGEGGGREDERGGGGLIDIGKGREGGAGGELELDGRLSFERWKQERERNERLGRYLVWTLLRRCGE